VSPGEPLQVSPPQFEVLPFPQAQKEAARLPEPARLTVTSSPRHGPEQTIEIAIALKALGHSVTPHLAARLVRDRDHLEALLGRLETAEIDDVFVIGGDSHAPVGELSSADELLPLIRERPHGVRRIGIAGYPEGHPLIDDAVLDAALERKALLADYVTTQMTFDGEVLVRWIRALRERGIELPVLVGNARHGQSQAPARGLDPDRGRTVARVRPRAARVQQPGVAPVTFARSAVRRDRAAPLRPAAAVRGLSLLHVQTSSSTPGDGITTSASTACGWWARKGKR